MLSLFENTYQMPLARLQLLNWGTFSGWLDLPIGRDGHLFTGPSGSGKSTILDAHSVLIAPPGQLGLNLAARETEKRRGDRNLVTYVRGAWSHSSTAEPSESVSQFLRTGRTWSALAETYRDDAGRAVTLAQVFWMVGVGNTRNDLRRRFLVLERELDLNTLDFFPAGNFDAKLLKLRLPDAFISEDLGVYRERFQSLLKLPTTGDSQALRLLHKTQSTKNLGDINDFMREFMLDEPQAIQKAEELVAQYEELSAAHQAVVTARQQIDLLSPAREHYTKLLEQEAQVGQLKHLRNQLNSYVKQRKFGLLAENIKTLEQAATLADASAEGLQGDVSREQGKLNALNQEFAGKGGGDLDDLQRQRDEAVGVRNGRERWRNALHTVLAELELETPTSPEAFVVVVDGVRERDETIRKAGNILKSERYQQVSRDQTSVQDELASLGREANMLRRRKSNMPLDYLEMRERLCADTGIAEASLPFAAELMQVKSQETEWSGAVERVLRGIGMTMLVEDGLHERVAQYTNRTHLGLNLTFRRLPARRPEQVHFDNDTVGAKLDFIDSDSGAWLRGEIFQHFGQYQCVASDVELREVRQGVTLAGLTKSAHDRHAKNDRRPVNDRSSWILGFNNETKVALLGERAAKLQDRLNKLDHEKRDMEKSSDDADALHRAFAQIQGLTWGDVDLESARRKVDDLTEHMDRIAQASPELGDLTDRINAQRIVLNHALLTVSEKTTEANNARRDAQARREELAQLQIQLEDGALTMEDHETLDAEFSKAASRSLSLNNLAEVRNTVESGLTSRVESLQATISELTANILGRFRDFKNKWVAESDGLDATLSSAEDFFAKLERLEVDKLPTVEGQFKDLLHKQSQRGITLLRTTLSQEMADIEARLEEVNKNLKKTEFNPGTYLELRKHDQPLAEIVELRQLMRSASEFTPGDDPETLEQRFQGIQALVAKLKGDTPAETRWREAALDVRRHVQFLALELELGTNKEVEVYRSGAGKSGGQRQKLATTCLAVALRYQLSGREEGVPTYCTVFMDEAFDKADADFTRTAMTIFKTFGFQMILATPQKSLSTLEPFISGATAVHIEDRKNSRVTNIPVETLRPVAAPAPKIQEPMDVDA